MTDRPQVNIRLEQDLLDEIDDLAELERADRSEVVRRLLASGLAAYRMETALKEYRGGRVTAWKAASIANVSLYEMLDRIHAEGIPYALDPDVLDRLDARFSSVATREEPAAYDSAAADAGTGIDALRAKYRPIRIATLFVGESSPAGGTHFYRANSNLFRATRAAFVWAFGDAVPDRARFLDWFHDQGYWLVDLADGPVNRLPPHERDAAVRAGIPRLADLLRETSPGRIIVVKASIAPDVREAASAAGFGGAIVELPFPVRQWRDTYERLLSDAVRDRALGAGEDPPSTAEPMTLDRAIEDVLESRANEPMTAREIADEIARRGTFRRPSDGLAPPAAQINARVSNRHYRERFERVDRRIRLRRAPTRLRTGQ
jgi:Arc/MetJ-type ribon-helix-helix transcriptional regulator